MQLSEIDLLDADRFVRQEHHEMFTVLRNEAPVFWHADRQGGGFWNVVKHNDLQTVNRDPDLFSSERGGITIFDHEDRGGDSATDQRGLNMIYTDPPKHTRYRRLVNKGFTPRMIGLLEQHLEYRARLIVDSVIERGSCEFVGDLAAELPLQAIAEIMGVPQEDRHLIFHWSNEMVGMDDPDYEGDPRAAAMDLYAYSHELAAARSVDPQDDIVTKLINADIEGDRLTELEIDMFMLLLSVAGSETTRNATSHGMYALLKNPDQLEILTSDLDGHLHTAVDEMVRWASPVLHFRRTATADCEIRGQQIAENDKVVIWHVSANRDEDVFDDPFTFDVTRDPNDHVGFGGGGAHYCLGANLARTELRLIFKEVLTRISGMELTAEPTRLRSNFISGIKQMPVTFTPAARVEPVPA